MGDLETLPVRLDRTHRPVGTWLSLVEHSLGVRGVGSSNLPVPTNLALSRFVGLPQGFCTKRSFIHPVKALCHVRRQQLVMVDFQQVINDEPDWFFGGHPLPIVEARKVYRTRKGPQQIG